MNIFEMLLWFNNIFFFSTCVCISNNFIRQLKIYTDIFIQPERPTVTSSLMLMLVLILINASQYRYTYHAIMQRQYRYGRSKQSSSIPCNQTTNEQWYIKRQVGSVWAYLSWNYCTTLQCVPSGYQNIKTILMCIKTYWSHYIFRHRIW